MLYRKYRDKVLLNMKFTNTQIKKYPINITFKCKYPNPHIYLICSSGNADRFWIITVIDIIVKERLH